MITVTETATRLWLDGDSAAVRQVYEFFKFRPPDYWRAPSFALWKRTHGKAGWDGFLSRVLKVPRQPRYYMMRGHRDDLVSCLEEEGIEHKLKFLDSPFRSLVIDDLPEDLLKSDFKIDIHQQECVVNLLKSAVGTVKATVSSGKTAVFFSTLAMIKRSIPQARALYVTPTERLVRQVYSEGKKFLPDLDISQYGGGKKDPDGKDVVVATAATIHANYDELVENGWLKSFMVLIYDECQFAGSPSSKRFLSAMPSFFRFGGSDSVKDERKEDVVRRWEIQGLLGPPRAEIEVGTLINVGRVAKPHLFLIDMPETEGQYDDVPHQAEPGTPAWAYMNDTWIKGSYVGPAFERDPESGLHTVNALGEKIVVPGYHEIATEDDVLEVESRWCLLKRAYDVAIINNKPRNKLVIDWAAHFAGKGWPTLVVATRTLHVHLLRTMAEDRGLDVEILTGEHSSKERDRVFEWLVDPEHPGRVLVSPIVKIGVSINQLRGGVIADYCGSSDLARQLVGRFIRKKQTNNHAEIAWFVDRSTASMRAGSLKLFKELEKIRGYQFAFPCRGPDEIGQLYEEASVD